MGEVIIIIEYFEGEVTEPAGDLRKLAVTVMNDKGADVEFLTEGNGK